MSTWRRHLWAGTFALILGTAPLAGMLAFAPSAQAGPHEEGWLGVTLQPLDSDLREALGIDRRVRGVLVNSVAKGSPADAAGVRVHDVLISVAGTRTDSVNDAVRTVRDAGAGEQVRLVVNRGGTERGLSARLGAQDDQFSRRMKKDRDGEGSVFLHRDGHGDAPRAFSWKSDDEDADGPVIVIHGDDGETKVLRFGDDQDEDENGDGEHKVIILDGDGHSWVSRGDEADHGRSEFRDQARKMREHLRKGIVDRKRRDRNRGGFLGVESMQLNDQLAEHYGVKEGRGVLITRVVEDSPAEDVGLKAGDVILAVDGKNIRDTDQLRRVVRAAGENAEVTVRVMREGREREFEVRLGESGDTGLMWIPEGDPHIDHRDLGRRHEMHGLHDAPEGHGIIELDLHGLEDLGERLERMDFGDWEFEGKDFDHEDLERLHDNLNHKLGRLQENLEGLKIQVNGHDWDENDVHEALEKARRALEKARLKIEREIQDDND